MLKILSYDSQLKPYEGDILLRQKLYKETLRKIAKDKNLSDFANGYHYFGLHELEDGSQVLREWAPGADEIYLYGDFNRWNTTSHPMSRGENGVFEIHLSPREALCQGNKYKILVKKDGKTEEHIPSYANYVTQDPDTGIWSSEVFFSKEDILAKDRKPQILEAPLIYECHIGMATEEYRVGTYEEFEKEVLPIVEKDGYNTIQIMAIMEHPYYASFGYQVTNFFAASSRYGTPDALKHLIKTAHEKNIRVLLDVVHSHASNNIREGLNHFDGTDYQYFHEGPEGTHPEWGTKLFDYRKPEVLHFLLSNLKYWMEEFHFDGFRFDGVTSMLYKNHGIGETFDCYAKYYSMNTDMEASVYLMLANELIHQLNPDALSIAEDMSGMPGLGLPVSAGGYGFDYRLHMGTPDLWIQFLEKRDEDWDLWQLWYQLTSRRPHEKVIGYAESHDQALVGDKTIMFRLCDKEMYIGMEKKNQENAIINRGMALHKMIRLLTFGLSRNGYLNFMGNEFGHPEWIDFPRAGNNWSHHYARRQWSLRKNETLKYAFLNRFDQSMLLLEKEGHVLDGRPNNLWLHNQDKVLAFEINHFVFVFNFHPTNSYTGYMVPVLDAGTYQVLLDTDDPAFGGYGRMDHQVCYSTEDFEEDRLGFLTYLPSRTALVFVKKSE